VVKQIALEWVGSIVGAGVPGFGVLVSRSCLWPERSLLLAVTYMICKGMGHVTA